MSDLKRRILDASVHLVAESGVRGVSFREVARRAGVSHQAPYHEFRDHLGIMRAIAREGFTLLADAMEAAAREAGTDPLAALIASGIAYVRFARQHVGHFRVMFQQSLVDLHSAAEPMPEGERTYNVLLSLAKAAFASGYGRGLDPQQIANVCWSVVHGIATLLVEGVLISKAAMRGDEDLVIANEVVQSLGRLLETKTAQPV